MGSSEKKAFLCDGRIRGCVNAEEEMEFQKVWKKFEEGLAGRLLGKALCPHAYIVYRGMGGIRLGHEGGGEAEAPKPETPKEAESTSSEAVRFQKGGI